MPDLSLTHEEVAFIVNHIPPALTWPSQFNPEDRVLLRAVDREEGGGAAMRLRMIAARQALSRSPQQAVIDVPVTPADLWALDIAIWSKVDYRTTRMDNGTPVMRLVEKLWDAMTEYHAAQLPPHLVSNGVYKPVPIEEHQRNKLAEFDKMIGEDD